MSSLLSREDVWRKSRQSPTMTWRLLSTTSRRSWRKVVLLIVIDCLYRGIRIAWIAWVRAFLLHFWGYKQLGLLVDDEGGERTCVKSILGRYRESVEPYERGLLGNGDAKSDSRVVGNTDNFREGNGELRLPCKSVVDVDEAVEVRSQDERCSREFQCAYVRLPGTRLASAKSLVHHLIRPGVQSLYNINRASWLDRVILLVPCSLQYRAYWVQSWYVVVHQYRVLQAENQETRSGFIDHAS